MSQTKKMRLKLPPGPRSLVPVRIFRELRRDPLAFLTKIARTYGDISTFTAVGQRYVIVNSPELAREILLTRAEEFWKGPALQNSKGILGDGLLTAEGETHRGQRRLMQPAFHAKHVENYAPEVIGNARDVVERWRKEIAAGGGEIACDIRPVMMGLTLMIAGRALFGAILADEIEKVHRCMDDLMNNYVRAVVPWGKLLNLLPLASTRRLARAQSDLRELVDQIIAAKRAKSPPAGRAESAPNTACPFTGRAGRESGRPDLLTTMLAATDTEAGGTRMTDAQLRDQSITILTAGHETTANAMTFTLYLLATHPEEQRRLREEVGAVLGDGPPTVDMLDKLPRTRWVLSESMRLLPPAWTLGRQNQREMELGGFRLPKKCTLLIPQWTLHRDPRFWDEPDAFMPERWREPKHPRFAYLPFSTGPRNCIGESFAWLEMMLALPMLVRAFEFTERPGTPPLLLTPAITLRPRGPVVLRVRKAD